MSDTANILPASVRRYARYLLVMAGLGGLIYGIDVGVIAAALPYIRNTSDYSAVQLGFIVGAVLWGSVISSLFAGSLSEWLGRKKIIIASAFCFFISIPVICVSGLFEGGSFILLTIGRTLQGASAGLVGVVVPMYLAECLDSESRGKGTGMFQLLLTIGLAFAAVIGLVVTGLVGDSDKIVKAQAVDHGVVVFEQKVDEAGKPVVDAEKNPVYVLDAAGVPVPKLDKDGNKIADLKKVNFEMIKSWTTPEQRKGWATAWQTIFLCSAVPGLILFLGAFWLRESPRWLYKKGRKDDALASLAANNGEAKAKEILDEMVAADKAAEDEKAAIAKAAQGDSLLQRKYVYPFLLAVTILACNQTTGINSVRHGGRVRELLRPRDQARQRVHDDCRVRDRRPQGPQVPPEARHVRHHPRALRRRDDIPPHHEGRCRRVNDDRRRRDRVLLHVHRVLRRRTRRVRVACAFRTHAHPHPRDRHVDRNDHQPRRLGDDRDDLPGVEGRVGLPCGVLLPRGLHGRLLHCGGVLPPRDEGPHARGDRAVLQVRQDA